MLFLMPCRACQVLLFQGAHLLPADCITRAYQVVEAEEEDYGPESLMSAVNLFHCDPKNPITYLAFNKKEMRSMWLQRELRKAAEDQLCWIFPCSLM